MFKRVDREPQKGSVEKPNLSAFICLILVAIPLLGAGIAGISSPDLLPWPPNPAVAWSLLGVGVMMDGSAVVVLLSELRRVQEKNVRRN